jgi:cold shock CspA family protein
MQQQQQPTAKAAAAAAAVATTSLTSRVSGQVKWFNLKAGYGFLSVGQPLCAGDSLVTTADVFVHHTNIRVNKSQFRYLVQGENVEFDVCESSKGDQHKFEAQNVKGPGGGQLTCEVKNEERRQEQRGPLGQQEQQGQQAGLVGQRSRPHRRHDDTPQDEWLIVQRTPPINNQQQQPQRPARQQPQRPTIKKD